MIKYYRLLLMFFVALHKLVSLSRLIHFLENKNQKSSNGIFVDYCIR